MDSSNLLVSNQPNRQPRNGRAVYKTPAGQAVVQKILAECLPLSLEPHDYQTEGICPAMD
ncbi:hypothetical protein BYT27DRAFT_7032307, partial [Phlegmacium glaucopus]